MQTFLPHASYYDTFKCLDRQRLGKQRVEATQILRSITIKKYKRNMGWVQRLWEGHTKALKIYITMCIEEWVLRGYVNNMETFHYPANSLVTMPWWWNLKEFHSTHRQTLLAKYYTHYKQFGWSEKPKYEYWWPIPTGSSNEFFNTFMPCKVLTVQELREW